MERRDFLKLTVGFAAGASALATSAQAAPLPPISAERGIVPQSGEGAEPAVASQDDIDRLTPEQVRWSRRRRWRRWWRRRRIYGFRSWRFGGFPRRWQFWHHRFWRRGFW